VTATAGGSVVVLGIGNVLLGDDAVGVHVIRVLEAIRDELPRQTVIVDGGTAGLSLLPIIEEASELVLVDAVDDGSVPGHVQVLAGRALYADPARLSVHEVGTADLIAAARLTGVLPVRTVLVGVQPGPIAPGLELSPAVAAAVPPAVALVRQWCHSLT
jgi:hydrogenase maturation protease